MGGSNRTEIVKLDNFDRHEVHKLENLNKVDEIILNAVLKNEKVLVVFNRVDRAQKFFNQISQDFSETEKMLIHSRFKRIDRNEKESALIGLDENGESVHRFNTSTNACIVVSTQVVEVSLDISFDVMITETAPLDGLIQRFGRINRKRTIDTIGQLKKVFVLPPPDNEKDAKPYEYEALRNSYDALPNGARLRERELQSKMDKVFTTIDYPSIEEHSVFKKGGKWNIAPLTNRDPLLMDLLEIDSVVCIVEADVERYLEGDYEQRMQYEISCRYYQVKGLPTLKVGRNPFILPDHAYSTELGLSVELIKEVNVESQII